MKYATGYALNAEEIFLGFKTKRLSVSTAVCEELMGNRHKEKLAEKIFKHALNLVLDDIIDNNATFDLPTRKRKAELRIKRFDRERFIQARKHGKWSDVDFLASNFTANHMILSLQSKGVMREKLVYLDPAHRNKISDYTNKGKQYY